MAAYKYMDFLGNKSNFAPSDTAKNMGIIEALLTAVSLCADCFAVSLCSGTTIKKITARRLTELALVFAVIQAGLLGIGYLAGNLLIGLIFKISHIVGFLLLLYVGGSMLIEGIRGKEEALNLNGLLNVVIGGVATSIDALAVGVAQSMARLERSSFWILFASVFAVTALSVIAGVWGGKTLGSKLGRWAEIIGGCVLIGIGVSLLF